MRIIIPLALIIGLFFATTKIFIPLYHYISAKILIEKEDYEAAYTHLEKCDNIKQSKEMLENFHLIYDEKIDTTYDENGKISTINEEKYKYDEDNNKIFYASYENGKLTDKVEYEYDKNGIVTLETEYDENGNISSQTKYVNPRMIYKKTNDSLNF